METRKTRAKRPKLKVDEDFVADFESGSVSSHVDPEDENEQRKSRIRDSNKEFAKRMTVLQRWSEHWSDYTTREGDAYPQQEAKAIIKKAKKIACPIASCGKTFTSIGGLKYHYARCKIERCFKCKVCNPPTQLTTRGELLRHMILNHYHELPELEPEQKEIADSILFSNRSEKKDKKLNSDTELLNNGLRLVRSYEELLNRCYSSESLEARPFKCWQLSNRHWELITKEMDRRKFYPPESESVHFKTPLTANKNSEPSRAIKTGDYSVLNDNPNSFSTVFFTGGVNTCCAWLPKSKLDSNSKLSPELVAVAVMCSSMDQNLTYRESHEAEMCIQFWTMSQVPKKDKENQLTGLEMATHLSYMVGFNYGIVFDMQWCPLGTSWESQATVAASTSGTGDSSGPARIGLLAVACGDGRIRILAVPSTEYLLAKTYNRTSSSTLDATPIFRAKPVAILMPPGVGQSSSDCQTSACKSISWNLEDSQRLIVAGYENGSVAMFDLSNYSPILYSLNDSCHIFHPIKSWIAHGAPVTGVAISSHSIQKVSIATGSVDRHLKLWNPMDLHSCLSTDRAPITKIIWDFRFRGVITATDTAFTSFSNRVIYRYPVVDSFHNITVSIHRSTVWGLSSSCITGAIATSDCAGEVFVSPQLLSRPFHKRDRSILSTHSIYTMLPYGLDDKERKSISVSQQQNSIVIPEHLASLVENGASKNSVESQLPNSQQAPLPEPPISEDDFTVVERQIANKPAHYLLPIEHKSVETYNAFRDNYGVEFVHYDQTVINGSGSKLPESCSRAGEAKFIYCDRPCDYPFSSVNCVCWSPNVATFPYLLSASQVGLCRIDKIQVVEQIFKGFVNSLFVPEEISTSNVNN